MALGLFIGRDKRRADAGDFPICPDALIYEPCLSGS